MPFSDDKGENAEEQDVEDISSETIDEEQHEEKGRRYHSGPSPPTLVEALPDSGALEPDELVTCNSQQNSGEKVLGIPMPKHSKKKLHGQIVTAPNRRTSDAVAAIRQHRREKTATRGNTSHVEDESLNEGSNAIPEVEGGYSTGVADDGIGAFHYAVPVERLESPHRSATSPVGTVPAQPPDTGSLLVATLVSEDDDHIQEVIYNRLFRRFSFMLGAFLIATVAVVSVVVTQIDGNKPSPIAANEATEPEAITSVPSTGIPSTSVPSTNSTSNISPPVTSNSSLQPIFQQPSKVAAFGKIYEVTTTDIQLSNDSWTGPIPSELGKLTALTSFALYESAVTGTMPSELGKLTALERLHLWVNELTGPIPPELGDLTQLTDLYMYADKLTGPIPSELGQLTALTGFNLVGPKLTGTIPSELGHLTALNFLLFSGNQLTGSIPLELGQLVALPYLELNNITFEFLCE